MKFFFTLLSITLPYLSATLFAQSINWTKNTIVTNLEDIKKIRVVNVDNDIGNNLDIVVIANPEEGNIVEDDTKVNVLWYHNNGDETFTRYDIDYKYQGVRGLDVGDFTGDGHIDIVVGTTIQDSTVVWYKNDGTPLDGGWERINIGGRAPVNYVVLSIDLNQDGHLDIVDGMGDDIYAEVVGSGSLTDSVRWFKNTGVADTAVFDVNLVGQYSTPAGMAFADFDGDGDIDVASGSWLAQDYDTEVFQEQVRWQSNNNGVFTEEQVMSTTHATNALISVDLDKNGTLDVVSAGYKSRSVNWWSNNGSGTFSSINTIGTNFKYTRDVEAADLDADGDIDIVAIADDDSTISWFENDGSQNFTEHEIVTDYHYVYDATIVDLDGDGDLDIVGSAQFDNELSWWESDLAEERTISAGDPTSESYYSGKVQIDFATGFSGGNTSVYYNAGLLKQRNDVDGTLHHMAKWGYYTIHTEATTYNAEITFNYSGINEWVAINDENDLVIAWFDPSAGANGQWTKAGTSQVLNTGANTIQVNGLSSELPKYAQFSLGSITSDNALPVELSSFKTQIHNGQLVLNWVTSSEVDNAGFELWRKDTEEVSYVKIADYKTDENLTGLGNSSTGKSYSYIDLSAQYGARYEYLLKDVDYNGKVSVSGKQSVDFVDGGLVKNNENDIPNHFSLLPNYPNPFNGSTQIQFIVDANNAGKNVRLTIFDALGRKVKELVNGSFVKGKYTVAWDGKNAAGQTVASGTYIYMFKSATAQAEKKMIFLK